MVTNRQHDVIQDNPKRQRFELHKGPYTVFADYRREGEILVLPHVEAPLALRGTGAAGELMRGVMEIARREGLKVIPTCGYAASWIRRHQEYTDLLAN